MAPVSLKIVLDDGAVTRTVLFDSATTVREAHEILLEKFYSLDRDKEYGLFLTSTDGNVSGIWLESHRNLEYYMLRPGDVLQYLCRIRNLRVRMLDGAVKTLQVDESKEVGDLLLHICSKIGISNHDEYGLCREEVEGTEELKPATGTLTLKRKPEKEKDTRLEQLSKILKTDDNVEWLNQRKTLRELKVEPDETLLLKRRLFYSDGKIDARDPVQLNLLYVQTRDNVLCGRQVTTEEKAIEFAGIQCQIHFGDFEDEKHKPGFIENLTEYLPEQYVSSWGIEKKIYREYRKHVGLTPLDAKYLYTKIARELPTYGVTFFLVKEREKNKKKLVPRLLGISSGSILRLDENTKEILKVWRLTQVKSYHAGKTTFTLNFGDYSDKEYTVKTNEAFRIRDILEGYIDIIRKKLETPFSVHHQEGQMVSEEHVEVSRGNIIQNVVPQKLVEQSYVGPSKIISHEYGQEAQHGTQIVTIQQMIVTNRGDTKQQGVNSEVLPSHIPPDFSRRLNRFNSQSVKAVMLLADSSPDNLDQVASIADNFEVELPDIIKGVEELAKQQTTEEERTRLLDELDQLCSQISAFSSATMSDDLGAPENLQKAEEAAKKIAELTTLIMFSLDPRSRKRSELLKRSRKSFIADERVEATLRRASFLTMASSACKAMDNAIEDLDKPYRGAAVKKEDVLRREGSAADKMGKLNAAVALLLAARRDPKNVDYEMAVNSMKTINELAPALVQDTRALSSTLDGEKRRDLLNQIKVLCESLNALCNLTGSNEGSELQDTANKYAKASGKLAYVFNPKSHGGKHVTAIDHEKEKEIMELTKKARDKCSRLLGKASDLTSSAGPDPRARAVDAAGAMCADAARGLLACSQIVAPTIHEPHCQSALTAAVEDLSSSAQQLALTWKPLVEEPEHHQFEKKLAEKTGDLMKSLERLKKSYQDLAPTAVPSKKSEKPELLPKPANQTQDKGKDLKRLQFITSLSAAKRSMEELERDLKENTANLKGKPIADEDGNKAELRKVLSKKIAQLNAAMASLVHAISNKDNPDYEASAKEINAINEITSELINDSKALCQYEDEARRKEILEGIAELCKATRDICAATEKNNTKDINDAVSSFANTSGNLCYVFNPRSNPDTENEILDLSKSACEQASIMLSKVYQLAEARGGEEGARLDAAGTGVVEAAQALLISAQLTAPSIADGRCQSALIKSADTVSDLTKQLACLWEPVTKSPEHQELRHQLSEDRNLLEAMLEKLRNACKADRDIPANKVNKNPEREKHRIKFITTTSAARNKMAEAEKLLLDSRDVAAVADKVNKNSAEHKELQRLSAQKLAELNGAIAALVRATLDSSNPDYETAETAMLSISELTPEIIANTNKLCEYMDEKQRQAMLENVRALCKATKLLCHSMEKNDMKELNNAANKFASSSGKLCYVFNPRANAMTENQILDLSKAVCQKTSDMLSRVNELREKVGGDDGAKLDDAGASVVDAAQALLTTAQITAPSISNSQCKSALLASADTISKLTQDLASVWEPIVKHADHQTLGNHLTKDRDELEKMLSKLRHACKLSDDVVKKPEDDLSAGEKQRLKFVVMTSAAKDKVAEAEKLIANDSGVGVHNKLNKDTPQYNELQSMSAQKLSELNGAIADLVRAASDSSNPDYETAETAMLSISELTPEIIANANNLCEYMDEKQRQAMLENVRELCRATKLLCQSMENNDMKELKKVANKFASSSGKLCYVFNPRANYMTENQILDLSKGVCQKTSEMLSRVNELTEKVGGDDGARLDHAGASVVNAAQALLTTAQITAPSISNSQCKSALLASADTISKLTQDLASVWEPIVKDVDHQTLGNHLTKDRDELEKMLSKLRHACKLSDAVAKKPEDDLSAGEKQRLKFVVMTSAAKDKVAEAEKLIAKDSGVGVHDKLNKDTPQYNELQSMSVQKHSELNAAIAALVRAASDAENTNYKTAEEALHTISQVTSEIVQNTNKLSQYEDEKQRREILESARALCKSNKLICDSVEKNDIKEINNAANEFAKHSDKLSILLNPHADTTRQNKILELTESACEKASEMLSRVYQLAEVVGGEDGSRLDSHGARVVDAAQALLTTAQITAPSINNDKCQDSLITSAKNLLDLTEDLSNKWEPIVQDPSQKVFGDQLTKDKTELEARIEELIAACKIKPGTTSKPQDSAVNDDKLKAKHVTFCKTIDEAQDSIKRAKEDLIKPYREESTRPAIIGAQEKLQSMMEQNLAAAGVAVSRLMADMSPEHLNYDSAIKATKVLTELLPVIVKDGKELTSVWGDAEEKAFLDDMQSLCDASSELCDAAKNNTKNLNEVAVNFGNKASKLLYNASAELDPGQEKEVIRRVREIGDSASRLAVRGAEGASAVKDSRVHSVCASGARCADAASGLLYTAKLLAPTIHNPESKKTLLELSSQLCSKAEEFSLTWQPLSSDPEHAAFTKELDNEARLLRSLLEQFKQDLKNDKLVKRRVVEKLVVQDTPLRRLATNILENANDKAELITSSFKVKSSLACYADNLAAAIRNVDLANAKCRSTPNDMKRREQLEVAVQDLQQICLQSRIQGGEQKHFVDLMDLINDVSSDAKNLSDETGKVDPKSDRKVLMIIKEESDEIIKEALESSEPTTGTDIDDSTLSIKSFAQKCEERVNTLRTAVAGLRNAQAQAMLRDKLYSLKGSSDLLRFALNSHEAAVSGAALEASQAAFEELENSIDHIFRASRKKKNVVQDKESESAALATATSLCCAVARRDSAKVPPALAAYVLEIHSRTDLANAEQKNRLQEHLKKLVDMLKTQNLAASRRVATWQQDDDGEIAEITHQIIQEIENFNSENCDGVQRRSADVEVLRQADSRKLLQRPTDGVQGDLKELGHNLEQDMRKLSSLASMVQLSADKRESLSRTLHAVADAASHLQSVAMAVAVKDPLRRVRIEDATEDMCSSTYHLLKTAEATCKDPHNPDSKRRLRDAVRLLNESINKLGRVSLPVVGSGRDALQRDCDELSRGLQLAATLQADCPSFMLSYEASLQPLLDSNSLQCLEKDETMSREECRSELQQVGAGVCRDAERAAHCGYLLSLPEDHQHLAREGFVNIPRLRNLLSEVRVACLRIIRCRDPDEANYIQTEINKNVIELNEIIQGALTTVRDPQVKRDVTERLQEVEDASRELREALRANLADTQTVAPLATKLLEAAEDMNSSASQLSVTPQVVPSPQGKARSEDVITHVKTMITKAQVLVKQVGTCDLEALTWRMFSGRRDLLTANKELVDSLRDHGRRAGFIEGKVEEKQEEMPKKNYMQIQLDLATKWLSKPASTTADKAAGVQGVKNIIELAEKMTEDMKGEEKVDMEGMIGETSGLLEECATKYNSEKVSLLLERLRELQSMMSWRVVARVVEDFLDEPLADLDVLADCERDEQKRKYILERKIAELLAQLGRVSRTARLVADAGVGGKPELMQTKEQVELLAPALVKAAQHRLEYSDNNEAVENYKKLLSQYTESMARLREICDQSVDPMDFAQAAGETMQRMREDSTLKNDPHACAQTSKAITRLGLRVITAGMCSREARRDPSLQRSLAEARGRLEAAGGARASKVPDWRDITAEILRTTGQVESYLGGENIFQKQPEPNQPIYAAALDLHATVREWSARDNEIVAHAKRMAVQMARLSDHMDSDHKSELLSTSKDIVKSSQKVAALARKLALECTDMRIRTNLMQVCERIPTISGQLKMLITVKGSSLGHQDSQEDKEAMNTLVGNAQNLMSSIQEVVGAAIGASVKIASQRGLRMKWVRRAYY